MNKNTPNPPSIRQLAKATGADRASIKKWLEIENVQPSDPRALQIVQERRAAAVARREASIDPKTGLSLFQQKAQQDYIRKKRENKLAAAALEKDYGETKDFRKIFDILAQSLATVPDRAKIELGLTDAQVERLRAFLKDGQKEADDGLRSALARAKAGFEGTILK